MLETETIFRTLTHCEKGNLRDDGDQVCSENESFEKSDQSHTRGEIEESLNELKQKM